MHLTNKEDNNNFLKEINNYTLENEGKMLAQKQLSSHFPNLRDKGFFLLPQKEDRHSDDNKKERLR
jgi:hypothetical protein